MMIYLESVFFFFFSSLSIFNEDIANYVKKTLEKIFLLQEKCL